MAHFAADDEDAACEDTRTCSRFLPPNNLEIAPRVLPTDDPAADERRSCTTIVPDSPNKPYDMREVIAAVVDDGEFFEVQAHFAQNIVVGFARLDGHTVGDRRQPAARARRACSTSTPASRPRASCASAMRSTSRSSPSSTCRASCRAPTQEYGGIIRHGAKLLYAFAEATVPKMTVITRKAYGGAYDVMASKHIRADFNFAWPTAEIAVMGPEGAVNIIFRREIARRDRRPSSAARAHRRLPATFANPYRAAELGFVDDVMIPPETRRE